MLTLLRMKVFLFLQSPHFAVNFETFPQFLPLKSMDSRTLDKVFGEKIIAKAGILSCSSRYSKYHRTALILIP